MTSKAYFKSLALLHFALTMGQVIFLMVLVYLHTSLMPEQADKTFATVLMYFVPAVALLSFSTGSFIYRTKLTALKTVSSLSEKLTGYRLTMITRFALWEGASLFSLIAYQLTGNNLFTVITVVFVLLFIVVRPTPEKLVYELELSPDEKAVIENPDGVVL
ncbi:MAG: hypothetical protein KIS94_10195 [Chitinophagales bacterium]|nr:hypothetical protein [Chitinophagales bacterium]